MRAVGVDTSIITPPGYEGVLEFVWVDTGGQSVYMSTNQVFMARRAVYLVLWRPSAEAPADEVAHRAARWVDALQQRVPGAPVLFIASHMDLVPPAVLAAQAALVRDTIQAKLADHARAAAGSGRAGLQVVHGGESLAVSSVTGEGVPAACAAVVDMALSLDVYGDPQLPSVVALRAALHDRARRDNSIPLTELYALAATAGVPDNLRKVSVGRLGAVEPRSLLSVLHLSPCALRTRARMAR